MPRVGPTRSSGSFRSNRVVSCSLKRLSIPLKLPGATLKPLYAVIGCGWDGVPPETDALVTCATAGRHAKSSIAAARLISGRLVLQEPKPCRAHGECYSAAAPFPVFPRSTQGFGGPSPSRVGTSQVGPHSPWSNALPH